MCLCSSAPDIQSPDQGTNTEPGHQPDNIRRKSFLLSRIFSKPPGKDQDDTDESDTGNNTPDNDKDESFVDQKKVRRKKLNKSLIQNMNVNCVIFLAIEKVV